MDSSSSFHGEIAQADEARLCLRRLSEFVNDPSFLRDLKQLLAGLESRFNLDNFETHEIINRVKILLYSKALFIIKPEGAQNLGFISTEQKPAPQPQEEEPAEELDWIEFQLIGNDDLPVAGEKYEIRLPDGTVHSNLQTDQNGMIQFENLDKGNCDLVFLELDQAAWALE